MPCSEFLYPLIPVLAAVFVVWIIRHVERDRDREEDERDDD